MVGDEPTPTFRLAQQIEKQIRIKTSQEARGSGHIQNALNVIAPLKVAEGEEMTSIDLVAKAEFAEVLWVNGNRSMALHALKEVQRQQPPSPQAAIQLARLVSHFFLLGIPAVFYAPGIHPSFFFSSFRAIGLEQKDYIRRPS